MADQKSCKLKKPLTQKELQKRLNKAMSRIVELETERQEFIEMILKKTDELHEENEKDKCPKRDGCRGWNTVLGCIYLAPCPKGLNKKDYKGTGRK